MQRERKNPQTSALSAIAIVVVLYTAFSFFPVNLQPLPDGRVLIFVQVLSS
jgi:hypothetical protein